MNKHLDIKIDLPQGEKADAKLAIGTSENGIAISVYLNAPNDNRMAILDDWQGTWQEFNDQILTPFFEDRLAKATEEEERKEWREGKKKWEEENEARWDGIEYDDDAP